MQGVEIVQSQITPTCILILNVLIVVKLIA
jgi:hypothetical protein